jgi:hypothetical protein
VTTLTAPARRSLLGQLLAALAVASPRLRGLITAGLPAIREHLAAFAAFTAIDYGAFTVWHHGGWIALGVSALLLEFKIRG